MLLFSCSCCPKFWALLLFLHLKVKSDFDVQTVQVLRWMSVNSQSRNISEDNQDALISPDAQEKAEIEFKRFAESVVNAEITNDNVDSLDDRVNQII